MSATCGGTASPLGDRSSVSPSMLSMLPSVMLSSLGSASNVGGIRSSVRLHVLLLS